MREFLRIEGWRTLGTVFCGGALGNLVGQTWAGIALALAVLLAVNLHSALLLKAWLKNPKRTDLPDGEGVWVDLYNGSYERHRRYRKRKKRLAAMLQEFRASTAALPDAAIVLNGRGEIAWSNQASVQLLGLQGQRDQGQRINNLIRHPDFIDYLNRTDSERGGVEIASPRNPAVTLWIRIVPYGKQQHLLIARDISAFKLLEQARRDFIANASHELRTPLTVMRGYVDMMVQDSQSGALAQWRDPLVEMRSQSARMQQIIADMLKLANLEATGTQKLVDPVNMAALLRACLEETEALSAGGHKITQDIDERLWLLGSQAEIHSIAANLLSNAVRYTPQGGNIRLRWIAQRDEGLLEVVDTGIGVSPADMPRLTERFYRADVARSRASGGTGLGLAIVKHAVERHDGRLEIDSAPGQGSTFRCRFPASRVNRRAPESGENVRGSATVISL